MVFKDKSFIEVFHKIQQAGGEVALVGGVVRNILLNEKFLSDNFSFDLATNLKPEKLINIFVPTTPNPTSGFLLMFPVEDVIYLNMTFEEASKFIVSAGTSSGKS